MTTGARSYRHSGLDWVTQIPRHWGTPPVGAAFQVQLGKMLNPEAVAGTELRPYLRNVNVQWDRLDLDDVAQMSFDGADRARYALRPGDLLVCEGGEVGRAALWHRELDDCYYQKALHRVRPYRNDSTRFLMYALMAAASQGVFDNEGNSSTIVHLTAEKLRSHRFPWPPAGEQRVIANYLDAETTRIDALIATKRELIALASGSFRARRAHLILRGLDPTTGAGSRPSEWQRPLLGVLIELHRGIDLPANSRDDGDVPVISSGGVSGSHSVAACRGPGVVTGRYGTIGEVFYVDGPYWPLNTTLYVSDFRGNHPRWIYHLLGAIPLEVDAEKSAVTGINRNVVGQLRVVLPPLAEQVEIAAALDDCAQHAARTVRSVERQIDLLLERRQALITAAVTGQLEIPGAAA